MMLVKLYIGWKKHIGVCMSKLPLLVERHVIRDYGRLLISPDMLPNQDGNNINGASLIKVPDWIENPLGKYYLYFEHHAGKYIRMAYSNNADGDTYTLNNQSSKSDNQDSNKPLTTSNQLDKNEDTSEKTKNDISKHDDKIKEETSSNKNTNGCSFNNAKRNKEYSIIVRTVVAIKTAANPHSAYLNSSLD